MYFSMYKYKYIHILVYTHRNATPRVTPSQAAWVVARLSCGKPAPAKRWRQFRCSKRGLLQSQLRWLLPTTWCWSVMAKGPCRVIRPRRLARKVWCRNSPSKPVMPSKCVRGGVGARMSTARVCEVWGFANGKRTAGSSSVRFLKSHSRQSCLW